MELLSINIQDFRNLTISFDAQGHDVNIFGKNGAGKTSTEDAFLWLLFGKDSSDRKDYDLIPHKPGIIPPDPDTGCGKEPTAEASIEYFGKTVKLKKAYLEEWPKRGEMKGKYAGSKVHYFVDDLEVKSGEYNSVVSELVDPDLFKLITNPHYFSESLSWQDRRATLVKIAGELSVNADPQLTEIMGNRPFEKFYALAKQNVKAKQKELDGLPYAISEARRMIPESLPELPDVSALSTKKSAIEEKIQTLKNDDSSNARRREIAKIETEISEARNKHITVVDAENARFKAGIERLQSERSDKSRELFNANSDALQTHEDIDTLVDKKSRKLSEWHSANDRVWTGSDVCPTCGQKFPKEQIESAKAKFNKQRSDDLERLKSEGLALKKQIEDEMAKRDEYVASADLLDHEIAVLDERIEKGTSMLKKYNFEETDEYKTLSARLGDLKSAPEDKKVNDSIQPLQTNLCDVQEQINSAERAKLQIEQANEQKKHVNDLLAREKEISTDLGKWEKAVGLCDQYVKAQAKALEIAVNGKFKIARFRMFQTQKNGEEAECCDVVYPNGSTNLSTGERLQVGVDIINTLSEYYGVTAPIWIDNAEGVTLPVETKAQVIRLIVSESDEKIRVEAQA